MEAFGYVHHVNYDDSFPWVTQSSLLFRWYILPESLSWDMYFTLAALIWITQTISLFCHWLGHHRYHHDCFNFNYFRNCINKHYRASDNYFYSLYALSLTLASLYSALKLVKVISKLKLTSSSLMTLSQFQEGRQIGNRHNRLYGNQIAVNLSHINSFSEFRVLFNISVA